MTDRPVFLDHLLRNLRLSAIIIGLGLAGVGLYALFAQQPFEWDIPIYLAIGMLLSSLINAMLDARRSGDGQGGTR